MTDVSGSGFGEVDRLLELVGRTRVLLETVAARGGLPDGGADYLAGTTLPHLDDVQSGFQGWLRAEAADIAELQYLLAQVGQLRAAAAFPAGAAERRAADAESTIERALARPDRPAVRSARPWDLAALAHARLVLALLPRLPGEAVRFPGGRPSYADIPAPRGPAELADRLAELERQLWRVATGRSAPRTDPGFRRTYGFFDAADQLGLRVFGLPG